MTTIEEERQKIIRLGLQQKEAIDALRAKNPKSRRLDRMEKELHKLHVHLGQLYVSGRIDRDKKLGM